MKVRFELGVVVATPGAMEALAPEETPVLLKRHRSGDWGNVPPEDARENEFSVRHGLRVVSSYEAVSGKLVWIITEADRSSTTILLPEDY